MKIEYFPETDSLYIDLTERSGVDTIEVGEGVIIDLDGEGHPVGIDIDQASRRLDLRTLSLRRVPVEAQDVAGERRRAVGPPLPPSAYEDIPGLPPFEPDSVYYEPGGLQLVWYWLRDLFRRRPHEPAA